MLCFVNHKETLIYTGASPYGISNIILQKLRKTENCKIVAYNSKALTSAENTLCVKSVQIRTRNNSVFGHFSRSDNIHNSNVNVMHVRRIVYISRGPFTVYSDHKPILSILNKPKIIATLRIFSSYGIPNNIILDNGPPLTHFRPLTCWS